MRKARATKIKHTANPEAGAAALEALGALVALMVLLPSLYALVDFGLTEMKKRAVAQHLTEVTDAAVSYGRKHYNALIDQSTPTSGPTIGIEDLRREQFLSDNFNTLNPWRQSYTIYSREPKEGELQLVILTQGGLGHEPERPEFANKVVPSTAALAKGGFIPTGLNGQPTGSLQGAYNAWRLDLAAMSIPSPEAGHLGAVTNLSSFDVGHDYLYRVEVPGHPELNEMWTELDMTDHAIERVKEIQFVPHTLDEMDDFCADPAQNGRFFLHQDEGLYICRDGKVQTVADTGNSLMMKNMTLAAHGERILKPHCPPGVDTRSEIFLSPVTYSAKETLSPPIVSVQTWADSISDAEWQVNLRLMTADPRNATPVWVYPTADLAQVMVMTLCRSNEGVTP